MASRKSHRSVPLLFALLLVAGGLAVLQPDWVVEILARRSPEVIYYVETEEPVVALTIDDGPDPVATAGILDLLEQYGARATFFLITTHIPGNEELVVRTVAEGHEIANHLTTDEPSILLDLPEFERRLIEAHSVLSDYSKVRWFRPGSGWYNADMLSIAHQHDYRCALGSVYPFDPQIPSARFAARYILANVRPGSIIVLHDYGARGERTIVALSTILPELNRRGLRVVTLSELVDGGATDDHTP
jgi:peptidoglycan/xylan/chitin deacetylase (PgdA/CDA1 family)